MKKQVQHECYKAHEQYVSNLIDPESQSVNKKFWTYIKNQRQDPSGIPPLSSNGKVITDDLAKVNIINDQFASIFTREDTSQIPVMNGNSYPDLPPIAVSCEGVFRLLSNLHPQKAAGPDEIPSRFLKEFASYLAPMLTLTFQASLVQRTGRRLW